MLYDIEIVDPDENSPFWHVYNNIKSGEKVLDVGCATGYLGKYLKKKEIEIVGIDYNDQYLEKAKDRNIYSELINIDLNKINDKLNKYNNYFDSIILFDVLEHLYNPMEVLKKLSKLLKKDGRFLVDLPNISHGSIKYNLLINNFNYTPTGLLDSTHIRFYTPKSIIDNLSKNQFVIEEVKYNYTSTLGGYGQTVYYEKYPEEIIDFIENDIRSFIFQIFLIIKKSDLPIKELESYNNQFKKINKEDWLKIKKHAPTDSKLKSLKEVINENKLQIKKINRDLNEKNKILKSNKKIIKQKNQTIKQKNQTIKQLNYTINKIKNSRSWKIMKPFRKMGSFARKLLKR
jgi:2-polyprenyl-3-methyl-5-hydroxy-6-metoxy-1,4-benzoquinol methylase